MPTPSEEGLIRGIRRWDLVAIVINAIIGAGVFGLPSRTYALIGSYSIIAFFACAVVVALIILCFAEVGSRFDATGGPYLYAREAFGATVGFEVGWLIWLARITAFAANCNLMISYLGYFWRGATTPTWRTIIIIVFVSMLALINVVGVRQSAIVSNCFAIGKLVPILIFIAVGMFFLNPHSFALDNTPAPAAFSQSVLLLVYAFTGFETATVPAGEIRDPQRNLPRALLLAIAVVAVVYILIQVVCVGTLPGLAQSTRPLADSAALFLGTAGASIISAGAIISISGNLNIVLLGGSRLPFAMAEQNHLPAFMGTVHKRFATPYVSIVLTSVVMLVLTLQTSFLAALTVSTLARLITYAATCAALPLYRRRKDAPPAAFRVPGGSFVAVLSLLLVVWLLANSTKQEAKAAAIAALVGLAIFFAYRLYRRFYSRAS
ncbi:MAG TPA: amino acid permease [Pyrinomonadaceae bacterium]|nr:amino acid permease [Pyrinomonadaceae bacterium]